MESAGNQGEQDRRGLVGLDCYRFPGLQKREKVTGVSVKIRVRVMTMVMVMAVVMVVVMVMVLVLVRARRSSGVVVEKRDEMRWERKQIPVSRLRRTSRA